MISNVMTCGLGGADKNVLRFMPPMCIEHHNIDKFAATLNEVLNAVKAC